RPCQAGDIALLAPSGTDLYVYERQLELRDVPIASQAGKGFFRRQEVQDLIAITRVLADARDTLALGALLRGPLVGMTEERLLDVVQAVPRPEGAEDRIPRLTLWTPADHTIDPICRHVIETLQALARRARRTTPYALLADAVAALHVRPLLEQRHRGEAGRALANVDLYLEQAHPYSVRGLRAFARHMRRMWEDDERQAEGRPDAEAEAVQVITMHSAKGLEWPVVIPINTMTAFVKRRGPLIRRSDDTLHMRLGGILPPAYTEVEAFEDTEEERQQVRLWYVGVTRARDLLVVPRLSQLPKQACWMSRIDFGLAELPAVELDRWAETMPAREAEPENNQDRETFARLLSEADLFLHGYRSDALEAIGFGFETRRALNPALIDVSLDAYGWSGPWTTRRAFDSLIQMSSGIAHAGMMRRGADKPVPLPVQALDQATGYLMATAALRGVAERRSSGRVLRARASLARTARFVIDNQPDVLDGPLVPRARADYLEGEELTDNGPVLRLRPPVLCPR
ncbi:MAG: CoA transferase, partial [bacterium]|nr:CoA transferase [bacterium]